MIYLHNKVQVSTLNKIKEAVAAPFLLYFLSRNKTIKGLYEHNTKVTKFFLIFLYTIYTHIGSILHRIDSKVASQFKKLEKNKKKTTE